MSNNNSGQLTVLADNPNANPATSLFFVAKYGGRTVAMRRNPDFASQATITSVQRVFPALRSLHPSCIRISAEFKEFGEILIELHADIWPEVVPRLMFAEVSTGDEDQPGAMGSTEMPRHNEAVETARPISRIPDIKPEPIVVHVQDTHGNIEELLLPLFSTSTIRQMKDLIVQNHDQLPRNLFLSYGAHTGLEDHRQLHEYEITNESTVSLTTEFKVYLVGSESPRLPVKIVTFASISALKLLYVSLIEGCPSSSKYYNDDKPVGLTLSCGGETLDEAQKLGSFTYLAPECEVFINEVGLTSSHANYKRTTVLYVYSESSLEKYLSEKSNYPYSPCEPSPLFRCRVFLESTILDLKVLASNKDQTSRQVRSFELTLDGQPQFQYPSIWKNVQLLGWGESNLVWLRDHPN